MIIEVRVQPKSSQRKIVFKNNIYKVYVNSPAENNRANNELIEILSEYFSVPKSTIVVKKGLTNRNKIIEISD